MQRAHRRRRRVSFQRDSGPRSTTAPGAVSTVSPRMIFLGEKRVIRGEVDLSTLPRSPIFLARGAAWFSYAGWSRVLSHVRSFFFSSITKVSMTLRDAANALEGKLLVVHIHEEEDILESGPPCVRIVARRYVTTMHVSTYLPLEDFSERNVTKVSLSATVINSTSTVTRQETNKTGNLYARAHATLQHKYII